MSSFIVLSLRISCASWIFLIHLWLNRLKYDFVGHALAHNIRCEQGIPIF